MSAEVISLNERRPESKIRRPRHNRYAGSPQWQKQQQRAAEWRQAFGERLTNARTQLGITKKEAAAAFQITLRTYQKYEGGRQSWRTNYHPGFWYFCQLYGVDIAWLLGFCENGTPPRFRLRAV
jgi:hypothetical protein